MIEGLRGIMAIAASLFDERGAISFEDSSRHVDWLVRAGSHAIVWPLSYSEVVNLAHDERIQGTPIVIDSVAGRLPVRIGVSAQCTAEATAYGPFEMQRTCLSLSRTRAPPGQLSLPK